MSNNKEILKELAGQLGEAARPQAPDAPKPNRRMRKTDNNEDFILVQAANEAIVEGMGEPDPIDLWHGIWFENEISCLFASSGMGKTILAVQIAEHVAQRVPVLYFDFELTTKQFQRRYTDENGNSHKFPTNLYRAKKQLKNRQWEYFDEKIIDSIEKCLVSSGCKVAIVDNISCVGDKLEEGDAAMELMRRFNYLKEHNGFSFLIIAHTPKRLPYFPITENDLAGSRKLYNSFDSVFAIGKSTKGKNMRYIKVLKQRNSEEKYDENNVIACKIVKDNYCLRFNEITIGPEREHLGKASQNNMEFVNDILELHREGKSLREIEKLLHVSRSTISRIVNAYKGDDEKEKDA